MDEELKNLLSRLDELKNNIKNDKTEVQIISDKLAPIENQILNLKKEQNEYKSKIELKKNKNKYLKPYKKICLKCSILYEILTICIALIISVFANNFLLIGLLSSLPMAGLLVYFNYLILSKNIRKELRKINLKEIEKLFNLNEEEILKYENEKNILKQEETDIRNKIREKAKTIQNLENEIKYLNQATRWQKQREEKNNDQEKNKELILKKEK